jgi:hypothetical protein
VVQTNGLVCNWEFVGWFFRRELWGERKRRRDLARDFWVSGVSLGQAAREQHVLEVRLAMVSDHQTFCITVLVVVVTKRSKEGLSVRVKKVTAKEGLKMVARRIERVKRKVYKHKIGRHFRSDRGLCSAFGSELPPYMSKGGFKHR